VLSPGLTALLVSDRTGRAICIGAEGGGSGVVYAVAKFGATRPDRQTTDRVKGVDGARLVGFRAATSRDVPRGFVDRRAARAMGTREVIDETDASCSAVHRRTSGNVRGRRGGVARVRRAHKASQAGQLPLRRDPLVGRGRGRATRASGWRRDAAVQRSPTHRHTPRPTSTVPASARPGRARGTQRELASAAACELCRVCVQG